MMHRWRRAISTLTAHLRRDCSGAVAVLFALLALPMIAVIGIAVDYAFYSQTTSSLALAANAAALNAAKVAATDVIAGDSFSTASTDGTNAAVNWFTAQLNANFSNLTTPITASNVTMNVSAATVSATINYNTNISSIFGKIFGVQQYPINDSSSAEVSTETYLDVELLLDNSASMEIAANPTDIATMNKITPCSPFDYDPHNDEVNFSGYMCSYSGLYTNQYENITTDSDLNCPIPDLTAGNYTISMAPVAPLSKGNAPSCQGWPGVVANSDGSWPAAGHPCAFACHSDSSAPAGTGNDNFALSRENGVTLRFDVLKAAVIDVINTMKNNSLNSVLNVGIFTFDTGITQIYPLASTNTTAGNDWATAISYVGNPVETDTAPISALTAEPGIQPPLTTSSTPDTNFAAAMTQLGGTSSSGATLTASGNGGSATSPRKVLIIVTDGVEDDGSSQDTYSGFDTSVCNQFKSNLDYTVYVLYTTYYPIMHLSYLGSNLPNLVASGGQISSNLQSCASTSSDYIEASSSSDITTALQTFLQAALTSPARFAAITTAN